MRGVGIDRDDAANEDAVIVYSGTSVHPAVAMADRLVLRITGNTNPSAQVSVYVYFASGA